MTAHNFRILHLSDFHWFQKSDADQKEVVAGLVKDLETFEEKAFDLLVFSGDLVFSGADQKDFENAKARLLDVARDACSLTDDQILICPGNHDLDRKSVERTDYLELGLKSKLVSTERLNEHVDRFFDKAIPDDEANIRLANYFSFLRRSFHGGATLRSNYVDCFKLDGVLGKIGIAVFNTGWRSTGAGVIEKETLLLPDRVVQNAVDHLGKVDVAIAVLHHPLDWLAPWNSHSVRTPLLANFDLLMFGHVHDEMPTVWQNPIGNCLFAQAGSLFESPKYWNGYQVIDLSLDDDLRANVTMRTWYHRPRGGFGAAERICSGGHQQFTIRSKRPSDKLKAKDLLAMQSALEAAADTHIRTIQPQDVHLNFDQSFTCPPLSGMTDADLAKLSLKDYKKNLIDLGTVSHWDGVTVFVGNRECGKTTLSYKIAKDEFSAVRDTARVPIRVDFRAMRTYDKIDTLARRFVSSLQLDLPAKRMVEHHRCLFIVDNASLVEKEKIVHLQNLIKANPNHDWVIFVDAIELLSVDKTGQEFSSKRPPVFIQPFGRPQIRSLVQKIAPPLASVSDVDTVIKLIDDNQLPRSAYIVTLVYAAMKGALSLDAGINEATLLDRVIDVLLNKEDPANMVRSSTDFGGLNLFLEEVAHWYHEANTDSFVENELLQRLASYLTDRGMLEGAARILDVFLRSGILEKRDNEIVFRYRSFQAFFLAKYAVRNRQLAQKLVESILTYSKEFSLLCDLSRHDRDLLTFLEVIVLELRPDFPLDKTSFMDASFGDKKIETVAEATMEALSNGPHSASQIDEMNDFRDRALANMATRLPKRPNGDPSDEPGAPSDSVLKLLGFFEAWRVWGRALTSLDFVELAVRKPSFLRLLDQWAIIAGAMSEAGSRFLKVMFDLAEKEGKSFPQSEKDRMEYLARVNMPISSVQSIFSHFGSHSIHRILIETFDELDLSTAEALGAVCTLIQQMPAGWDLRVRRYIDEELKKQNRRSLKFFLLEALSTEYSTRILDKDKLDAVQSLLAHLLTHGGFVKGKTDVVLNRLRQERVKLELRISSGPDESTR